LNLILILLKKVGRKAGNFLIGWVFTINSTVVAYIVRKKDINNLQNNLTFLSSL